jgi:tetratricopeptide (TPR) repeat protein
MKIDPLLGKAAHLAKRHNFESALNILIAEENRYSGSFKYYYLYAVICLYSGDFGGALANFRIAHRIKMKEPLTMLGLAVLYLKRMNTAQAVDFYLDVQEMDKKNKIAKKALAIIRKFSDQDSLSDWLTPERLSKLYPPIPGSSPALNKTVSYSVITAVVIFIVLGVLVKVNVLPNPFKTINNRPTAEFTLSGQERGEPVEVGGFYGYILTRDQAVDLYDKALSFFSEYRDERARINLNRILRSNSSEGIKNKAKLMIEFMQIPGFDNFNRGDNFSFTDVKNEPAVYEKVHVIWKGIATNVEVTETHTLFDLLVGYDTRTTLEGIVPIVFEESVAINTERPLEILGHIIPEKRGASNFYLKGVAIHQSGKLEN